MEPTHSTSRRLPVDGDQLVLAAVHDEQRRRQRGRALRHRRPDPDQRLGDPCGQLAVVHQRVGLVGGDHLGIAGHRVGGQVLDGQPRQDAAEDVGHGDHHRGHRVLGVHRGAGQHHRGVVVGMLDPVGEDDAAAHAVAEHHALESRVRRGGDADQVVEVVGVLGDVLQVDPLAAGAAVSTQVERVGDQPGLAEALARRGRSDGRARRSRGTGSPRRSARTSGVHTS